MGAALFGVIVGGAVVLATVVVVGRMLMDGNRSPEDEALEVVVRRLLCATEIRAVEDLAPDHVRRLRAALAAVEATLPSG